MEDVAREISGIEGSVVLFESRLRELDGIAEGGDIRRFEAIGGGEADVVSHASRWQAGGRTRGVVVVFVYESARKPKALVQRRDGGRFCARWEALYRAHVCGGLRIRFG